MSRGTCSVLDEDGSCFTNVCLNSQFPCLSLTHSLCLYRPFCGLGHHRQRRIAIKDLREINSSDIRIALIIIIRINWGHTHMYIPRVQFPNSLLMMRRKMMEQNKMKMAMKCRRDRVWKLKIRSTQRLDGVVSSVK